MCRGAGGSEDRLCATSEECAVHAGAECEVQQDGHDADAVLLQLADGCTGAAVVAALCGDEAGISRFHRYCEIVGGHEEQLFFNRKAASIVSFTLHLL